MNDLLSYQFEHHPVRVVMRGDQPWFMLSDLCEVLDIRNPRDAGSRLDDDERDGVGITDAIGRPQETIIISESGLWALVLRSRKPQAKRFRRWITGEVIPTLRRTGTYSLSRPSEVQLLSIDTARLNALVGILREARRLHGPDTARAIWRDLGLHVADSELAPGIDPYAGPLREWLGERTACNVREAMREVAASQSESVYARFCRLLRSFGWEPRPVFDAQRRTTLWFAPAADASTSIMEASNAR